MKLKELMKPKEKKPLLEMVGIETLDSEKAVELSIDDATLHIKLGSGIQNLNALKQLVAALVLNRVFVHGMYDAVTRRHTTQVTMSLDRDGVKFHD